MKQRIKALLFSATLMCSFCLPLAAQASAADRAKAADEFRRGVQAYYRGAFNDSILVFENALSYLPGEPLILEWLGRSYYRSGIEDAALQQWQFAVNANYGGELLRQKIETVRERRTVRPLFEEAARFVEAGEFPPKNDAATVYRQPVSITALKDGGFWASAYGSNELLRFDVNGVIVDRARGPLGGFDRPLDLIALADGRMLVSEVGADRVSVLSPTGQWLSSFGKKGRGTGELVGPQYIAVDDSLNVYVTDYGNARVVAFDGEGNGLFSFGKKTATFPGFRAPGGIAFMDQTLYVADTITGALHVFDTAGNFIETLLPEGSLVQAEAIRVWNGYLLVSMGSRVLVVDPVTGSSFDAVKLGNAPARITCAAPDANGHLILADYRGNTIQIVSRIGDLVGGLFVHIDRVYSDAFPQMTVEVRVEDRYRKPVVGLKQTNFLITEEKRPVSNPRLIGSGYLEDVCDITVLVERSPASARYMAEMRAAIEGIAAGMNGKGTLRIVSAGAIPVQEGSGNPQTGAWKALSFSATPSATWAFDLGLRLAVNDLVNASKKRAVVYLSTGAVTELSFTRYGLNDLASYMANNGVQFSIVRLTQGAGASEYEYLAKASGGASWYVYRQEGLGALVDSIRSAPNGSYVLSYTSVLPTDFGRAYLPLEIEAWLMKRSGRDESGYFAPLE